MRSIWLLTVVLADFLLGTGYCHEQETLMSHLEIEEVSCQSLDFEARRVHFHKTLTAMRHHMEDELAAFKLDKGRSPEDLLSFRTNLEQFSKKKVPSIAKPVKRAMACFGREYQEGFGFQSPIDTEDLESRVLIEIDEYREKLSVLVEQALTLTSDNQSATENHLDYQVQQFTNGASERTRHFVDTCSRLLEGSLLLH